MHSQPTNTNQVLRLQNDTAESCLQLQTHHTRSASKKTQFCKQIVIPIMNRSVQHPSPEMGQSVSAVEQILGYNFTNKRLLEEALTHPSYTESASYQRLEFIGDAAISLALSNYFFLSNPGVDPGTLSLLRSANVSTEKLARVAVRHGLYHHLRHNAPALLNKVITYY